MLHTQPHSAPLLHSGPLDADHSTSMPVMGFNAAGISMQAPAILKQWWPLLEIKPAEHPLCHVPCLALYIHTLHLGPCKLSALLADV